jgi:uncharacterized protein
VRVGVLSDTHNLLRPRVLELLAGCDRILHAGDVGELEILRQLERIAPVAAVRGNTDSGRAAAELPEELTGSLDGLAFGMIHRREDVPGTGHPGYGWSSSATRTGRRWNGGASACS